MANVVQDELTINIKSRADDASQSVKKLKNDLQSLSTILKGFGVGAMFKGLKNTGSSMFKFLEKTSNALQTMRQFQMVMGESAEKAQEFVDKAERIFGLDPTKMQTALTTFKSLGESFGIASNDAYKMSINLTQLAADMSSMKNISFEQSLQKIKSGFAGEIEPMRAVGIALDKATLQQTAYTLGIEQRIDTMTRAQKTELLYYQMMTATEQMQGNMAKQLITPATAIRQIQAELTQLGRAVGSILIPAFMAIAPVIRAIIELATEAAQALAAMLGFKLGDFAASASDVSSSLSDIGGGLGDIGTGARKATKELNKMLMPFDELNNINLENKSGAGGGAGGIGGIGGSLGIPLEGYDMFANASEEMRQKIDSIKEAIKNFLPVIKLVGAAMATLWIVDKVVKFINWVKNVKDTFESLWKWFKSTALGKYITNLGSEISKMFWNTKVGTGLKNFINNVGGVKNALKIAAAAVGGIVLSIKGFTDLSEVMNERMKTGTLDAGKYATALGEIAGGFGLIGYAIGGLKGGAIGLVVGAVLGLIESLMQSTRKMSDLRIEAEKLNEEITKQKEIIDKDIESWNNLSKTTQDNLERQMSQADHVSELIDTLGEYVDESGRVQDADKARVDFILNELNEAYGTNYKLVDGQITQNGKEVKSLKELQNEIQKVIDKKKAEAIIDATADKYAEALLKRGKYYDEMQESSQNLDKATKQLKETFAKYGIELKEVNGESVKQAYSMIEGQDIYNIVEDGLTQTLDAYEKAKDGFDKTSAAWEDANDTITEVERLRTATLQEDYDMTNKILSDMEGRYEKNGKIVKQTIENQVNQHIDAYKRQYNQLTEQEKQQQEQTLKRLASNLTEQTRKIEQMTPDMVKAWKNIAETSRETYDENISKIDEGTRLAIETSIGVVDTNSPDTIERWKKLAQDSESEYNRAIGLLPEDTRNAIGSATGVFYKEGQNFKNAGSYGGKQAAVGTNQSYYQSLDLKISGNNIKINPKGFDNIGNAISNLIQGNLGKFNIKFATKVEPIPNFATGGFPETGQLFVANEAGPELVGNIGRKTAVANQGQITEGIAEATYNAISRALSENKSSGGSTPYITVNVGNERLYSGYGKFQNEQSNMYGVTI